ncbi:1,4-alpha-glucan branching protein [Vibrio breoganii]|uniref:1,4-alpha-glucan branching protein n=1 Tax=Vibrio breoganii TaxID=553239 RepID=A0AAJ3SBZ7_9VIBR|nr:isoamylase early set domain-containing protein [Vibrio breoganii]ANO34851.1 1,4-alpha-glucan branching protein [Vibrio breoganii]MDN3715837.1 isoamylase early set domain-containing protein [Vibrio breoganii]OED84359.1 1,4-alpha-glucan branching protein [Vibrio breoganii ZF-55]OEF83316.1 1,4-alpha-glucan branching protein [Vibrio breoganii 1C10]PMG08027.1 1,4-alpha-glucan branching protein [Vibrio breoganii]
MLKKRFFKTKNEVEVTFEWPKTEEQSISVAGDFTDWQPVAMKYNKTKKAFNFKTRFPKNEQFQFRYLIDGEVWENDPKADDYVPNDCGTDNSLVSTAEA